MNIKKIQKNNKSIAVVKSSKLLIKDVQSALNFIATVRYETDCDLVVLNKEAIAENFFRLSTGLAGEILQKFINYYMKLAIVGEFSYYTSKPLQDFIYESNNGNSIFFTASENEAIEKLVNSK